MSAPDEDNRSESPSSMEPADKNESGDVQPAAEPPLTYEPVVSRRGNMGLVALTIGILNCGVVVLGLLSPPSRYPVLGVWREIGIPMVGVLGCPVGLMLALIGVGGRERASWAGVVLNCLPYVVMIVAAATPR